MGVAELITLNNSELTRFFFAIVLLLISAHWFGYIFQRFKLPRVIGEIVGGLVLGPTLLGYFSPASYDWIFNAFDSEGKLISIIYWIGLVLLVFIAGFEIQKPLSKNDRKTILVILLGATMIPFLAGWLAPSFYDFSPYLGTKGNMLALKMIIAIAATISAIPVISKIFIDLGIINTHFAKIVLAIATIEDAILWIALAITTGLVNAVNISTSAIVLTVLIIVVFFGIGLLIMPRLISYSNNLRYNLLIKSSVAGYMLLICFFFAALASLLNVNILFGAFLAGIIIGSMPDKRFGTAKTHIKEVSLGFFIPICFAVIGLKLDLVHKWDIMFFLGFLLFTTISKTFGTIIAAKLTHKDWLSSFNLAVATNTKGGVGIVLATVAFDLGIINEPFFVVLVMTAIVTSLLAGCWFKLVLSKGWKLLKEEAKETAHE